jgi:hypothetical protein
MKYCKFERTSAKNTFFGKNREDRETTRRNRHSNPTRRFAIIGFAHDKNEDRETACRFQPSNPTPGFAIIGFAHGENEGREAICPNPTLRFESHTPFRDHRFRT